jgi:hypothetical protein
MASALLADPVEQHVQITNDAVSFSSVKDGVASENWIDRRFGVLHNADGTTAKCSAFPENNKF